jgi:hypothetical protein
MALKNLMTGFLYTTFSVHCVSSLFKIKKRLVTIIQTNVLNELLIYYVPDV